MNRRVAMTAGVWVLKGICIGAGAVMGWRVAYAVLGLFGV